MQKIDRTECCPYFPHTYDFCSLHIMYLMKVQLDKLICRIEIRNGRINDGKMMGRKNRWMIWYAQNRTPSHNYKFSDNYDFWTCLNINQTKSRIVGWIIDDVKYHTVNCILLSWIKYWNQWMDTFYTNLQLNSNYSTYV